MAPHPDQTAPDPRASDALIRQTFLDVARSKRLGWLEAAEADGWEWVFDRRSCTLFVGLRRVRDGYKTRCRRIEADSVVALQEYVAWRAELLNDDLRVLHDRENPGPHYYELGTPK